MTVRIETIPVGPLQCNCSIVADEATWQAVVVDPGDEGERIGRALARSGLKAVALLHTHGHFDHIGGTAELATQTGAAIRLHPGARFLYDALPDSTPVICGHGPSTTIEEERVHNPFAAL